MSAQTILDGEAILGNFVTYLLNPLYQLAAALAVLYFLYGGVKYIYDMNDPEKKNTGKSHLFWGLVGLFIIFSVGAILRIFNDTLGGIFRF